VAYLHGGEAAVMPDLKPLDQEDVMKMIEMGSKFALTATIKPPKRSICGIN